MKKETTKKQKQNLEQNIKVKTLKQNTKSNTETNQGITLIALVITIVVLLILAGVAISMLSGENGILSNATKAAVATEIAGIEEEANLIYSNKLVESLGNSNVSMADVVSQLQAKGYNVYSVSSEGSTITGIALDNDGSLSVAKGGETATIKVSYLRGAGEFTYYAIVKGNYYLMTQTNGKIQISRNATNIEGNSSTDTLSIVSSNSLFTATINGDTITITSGSNIGEENLEIKYGSYSKICAISIVEPSIDSAVVAKNATTYYGALVENYNVTYDNSDGATNAWRIFYADGEDVAKENRHIYLIADDYIHYDYAPKSASNIIYKNSNYKLSFNNVYNDYTGSESISSSFGSKWLSSYWKNNSASTKTNIRAVAYMLDTSIWNTNFKNEYADYAIGGPTLEMFCASYKDTHPDKYIECEAETSTNGYNVKWSTDTSYSISISGLTRDELNSVYIKSSTTKADAMWLASPSAYITSGVLIAACSGFVGGNYYGDDDPGFRPLVCLSSNIQLEKQENGNYKIVEEEK